MAIEAVRAYFQQYGIASRMIEFSCSSETVALAAQALACEPGRIAKSLTFLVDEDVILVVASGDARIDNAKYKTTFHKKAKMIPANEVETLVGHAVGGVCPFALKEGVNVYLDVSLRAYTSVFPACGSGNSCIEMTLSELETYAHALGWVDVCKKPQLPSSQ